MNMHRATLAPCADHGAARALAEGAVVMSRAEQDIEPFETVAKQLVDQARALTPKRERAPKGPLA